MPNLAALKLIDSIISGQSIESHLPDILSLIKEFSKFSAQNAVLHPLGFIIITLQDWYDNKRLRLHIWPEKGRVLNNNQSWIHNHEYSVHSFVLMGKLINSQYKLTETSEINGLPLFQVVYNSINSDLMITDRKYSYIQVLTESLKDGEKYYTAKWEYHKVDIPDNQITCTLVVNFDRDPGTGSVIGNANNINSTYEFARTNYDSNQLIELINNLEVVLNDRILEIKKFHNIS